MDADFNKPVVTDNHATVYTPTIKDNLRALAVGLDPAKVAPINLPTDTIVWNSGNKRWERWTGVMLVNNEPTGGYAINISGNAAAASNAGYANSAGVAGSAENATNATNVTGSVAGSATGTTQSWGDNSTKMATTAYADRLRRVPASTNTTVAAADAGKCLEVSTGVTVPNGVMSAGDVVTIFNTSAASIPITAGITTLYLAGTANTGNRTLAQRGLATIRFISGTVAVISGAGLS